MNIGDFLMRLKAKHFFLWSLKKYEHLLASVISILWKQKTMEKAGILIQNKFQVKSVTKLTFIYEKKWGD